MKLRDFIEDMNGNQRAGDTLEMMKKELRKIRVVENREESFKKDNKTYYGRDDNNRSRYSHPKFF